jgi:DNA-binding CsgD family transcriptional regulator
MDTESQLETGRESFKRGTWGEAYAALSAGQSESALAPDDLERLATAAYLTGRDDESDEIMARAHHQWLRAGDAQAAARCAFWLGFGFMVRGEEARSSGWLSRAHRLLDDCEPDCAERGLVLVPVALATLDSDPMASHATFAQVSEIGGRLREPDLVNLGRLGRGQALIRAGRTTEGVALLDEAMVAVTADEVSARVAGIVYCAVIGECQNTFDLRRARQWTAALTNWCDSQPDLVPYRGQCLLHRAELMQLQGDWPDAIGEAQRACQRLAGHPAAAVAYYQLAELHRLRGEFAAAEDAYTEASRRGYAPQPGLALLRLAQGKVGAAAAAMRTVVDDAHDRITRSQLLSAYVEVLIAAGDVKGARTAADELAAIADDLGTPFALAVSAHAKGAVCLAEGDARAAMAALRGAWTAWQKLDAPYEAARVRVLLGLACRELGDHDGAALELDAARWVFQQLGAAPDLSRVEKLFLTGRPEAAGPLTAREVEVLRLVALGKSNRAIAADLFLSEKTVARHVSNILTKLALPSRSAATAYAYENGLA